MTRQEMGGGRRAGESERAGTAGQLERKRRARRGPICGARRHWCSGLERAEGGQESGMKAGQSVMG